MAPPTPGLFDPSARRWRNWLVIAALMVALAGCGDGAPPPPTLEEQTEAQAAEAAALYQQLRQLGRMEQAELAGRNVLEKYPDSAAAAEVRQTYEALRSEVEQTRETGRLAGLWVYHAVPEGDGSVNTATIQRSGDPAIDPAEPDADLGEGVRLVLRRHPEWGQAVYLLIANGDFDCAEEGCTASVAFDQAEASDWEATVSREGPLPALFIEDDEPFIEALQQAATVHIEAPLAAEPARALHFEVGGFDRAAWLGEQASDSMGAEPMGTDATGSEAQDATGEGDAGDVQAPDGAAPAGG